MKNLKEILINLINFIFENSLFILALVSPFFLILFIKTYIFYTIYVKMINIIGFGLLPVDYITFMFKGPIIDSSYEMFQEISDNFDGTEEELKQEILLKIDLVKNEMTNYENNLDEKYNFVKKNLPRAILGLTLFLILINS